MIKNIEMMLNDEADVIIEDLFQSCPSRCWISSETTNKR